MSINPFKRANLQAPRYRPKPYNVLNWSFFYYLRKEHPELKKFTDAQIRNVIKSTNEAIYKKVIDFRDGVELPESLGYIFLGTCPKKIKPTVDFRLSTEYRQLVEHRNWESDGYLATIFYTNFAAKYRFKFHSLWEFSSGRNFSRTVGKTYPDNWKKYIQVDHSLNIARLFRRDKVRTKNAKDTQILLENYNEFEGF